jgi:TatA/E family protein of Tat protein translocase
MFNLDPAKLLIIAVVAIILLGPDRLPQLARQVGGAWRTFNEYRHRMESEVRKSIPDLPSSTDIARLARSPSAFLNHLSNMSGDNPSASDIETPVEIPVARADSTTTDIPSSAEGMTGDVDHPQRAASQHRSPAGGSPSGDPGLN